MRRLNAVMTLLTAVILTGMTCGVVATGHEHVDNKGTQSFNNETFEYLHIDPVTKEIYTRGGAINNTGTLDKIDTVFFYEDQAKYGGAISSRATSTITEIVNTVFERNSATQSGGAIYSEGFFRYIRNSKFISNGATGTDKGVGYGGAIWADLNRFDLTIADTSFTGNYAYRNGGAIALMDGDLNIVDSTGTTIFTGNNNNVGSNDIYMGGKNQTLTLTAYGNDGLIRLDGGIDFANNLTININGVVSSESEDTGTGVIFFNGDSGSTSKRANMNMYGGTFSLSSNTTTANINTIYAGKVTIYNNTKLGFDIGYSGYDIFNFSSISNTNYANFLLYEDSFNIPMDYIQDDSKSEVLSLIVSSSSFKKYIQFMDGDKKVSVLYKYYDNYKEGKEPKYKIRLTSDGKFIISVPEYIDPESNPLAYAVNYDAESTNQNNASASITGIVNDVTLTLKKNITIDSWEDLPDEHRDLHPRNIQKPKYLTITAKNKTITAIDNLEGMVVDSNEKALYTSGVTFEEFNQAITNEGGNIVLEKTGFKKNVNLTDNKYGSAIINKSGIVTIVGTKSSKKALFYNNISKNGGVIYNSGNARLDISYANFGANGSKSIVYSNVATEDGGVIYNLQNDYELGDKTVENLKITNSNFVDNVAVNGGAIYNKYADGVTDTNYSVSVGGNFTRNDASKEGGAIYNTGNLTALSSTFGKKSKAVEANTAVNGGAVANKDGGHFTSENSSYYSNDAIGDINATGQVVEQGKGGAIYNTGGSTTTIKGGNFTSNTADLGGAIFNDQDSILELDAYRYKDQDNKYTLSVFSSNVSRDGNGGAIYNLGYISPTFSESGSITSLAGTFTKNKATMDDQGRDDEILMRYNKDTKEINYVVDATHHLPLSPKGGAIYNEGSLDFAGGELSSNTASSKVYVPVEKYTEGAYTISEQRTQYAGLGGAVYSNTQLTDGEGHTLPLYITNTTISKNTASEAGGAIYNANEDSILHITNSDIKNNSAKYTKNTVQTVSFWNGSKSKTTKVTIKESIGVGGAIYSNSEVNVNTGSKYSYLADEKGGGTKFTSNTAVKGGAIYTEKGVNIYKADFSKNSATYSLSCNDKVTKEDVTQKAIASGAGSGGAIYAKEDVNIKNSNFASNKATYNGGAIYTTGNVSINALDYTDTGSYEPLAQTVAFTSNTAQNGGAIYTTGNVFIKDATFTSNKASGGYGGAIYAEDGIQIVNTDFNKNSAKYGGALYVAPSKTAYLINSSFTNNSASEAGGAIYADEGSSVYISAFSKNVTISGNKAGGKANSFYLAEGARLYLYAHKTTDTHGTPIQYQITLADGIIGNRNTHVEFYGEGILYIPGKITGVDYSDPVDAETKMGVSRGPNPEIVENSQTIITSPEFVDLSGDGNGSAQVPLRTLAIGNENLVTDTAMNFNGETKVDIANNTVGKLALRSLSLADDTKTYVVIDASLKSATSDKITAETVEGTGTLNVSAVNLTSDSKTPVSINIGEDSLVTEMSATKAETAQATYKLKAMADQNGNLMARAYGQKAKPCTLAAPVAAQLGGYLTQINSYDQAFMNMDMNMTKTREERQAEEAANRYAYNGNDYTFTSDNGINRNGKGLWARPYATFERVNLGHGPKVGNIAYGSFFGGDADLKHFGNGWARQFSAYIGYNGSNQDFNGQSIDQNGGTIGVAEVWYKNNFFTGLTVNVGANAVNASTDLGHENFPMLMAGVASKTGYNFEFKQGKFIIQPSILLSYSFVHTFSHRNGLGNKVSSSPLHAVQVAPGLKFIFNLPKGWQPYLGVNMRWNIIDKTHFGLQDVSIPDMSIRPYIEYGVGVQRKWGERFTGYGQAMIRNGGRNGVMLSVGFRWALGK